MQQFLNRCIWTAVSAGLGDFVVGAEAQNGYVPASCLDPAQSNGATYHYFAILGIEHEEGDGVYTVATKTLTRATIRNSSSAGGKVNFPSPPTVFMGGPIATDIGMHVQPLAGHPTISDLLTNTVGAFKDTNTNVISLYANDSGTINQITRDLLTADRTYYVATTGSDITGTGTIGNPWGSAQHAYNVIVSDLDLAGFNVTIQMADGTYGDSNGIIDTSTGPWTGGGNVTWQGNLGNRAAVIVNAVAAPSSNVFFQGTTLPGIFTVQFMRFSNPGNGLIEVFSPGYVIVRSIDMGAASWHLSSDADGCIIDLRGDITIFGNTDWHAACPLQGTILYTPTTVTLTGVPNWTQSFFWAEINSAIYMTAPGPTFIGAGTGKRFFVHQNSIIRGGGAYATFLPGNAPGTLDTGGVYYSGLGEQVQANNGFAGIVSALPAPATVPVGQRAWVTDSTVAWAAGIGNVVAGLGGNACPVTNDGAAWRIG